MAASGAAATPQAEPPRAVASPTLDEQTLTDLRATFPSATGVLDRMAELLAGPATDDAQAEFRTRLKEFAQLTGTPDGDGETDPSAGPGMLRDDHTTLFERFRDALRSTGAQLPDGEGGQAGIGDSLRGGWTGAKEALRQATYWQMKNRAGVVGRRGLAPLIGELHQASPELRVPLVGHSFGARLVANALAGLPDSSSSPVGSLTPSSGSVLALRLRRSPALRRRSPRRTRRPTAAGRRPGDRLLLQSRQRGRHPVPVGLPCLGGRLRRRGQCPVQVGRDGCGRGPERRRGTGRRSAGRPGHDLPPLPRPDPQHRLERGRPTGRPAERGAQRHRPPRTHLGRAGRQLPGLKVARPASRAASRDSLSSLRRPVSIIRSRSWPPAAG